MTANSNKRLNLVDSKNMKFNVSPIEDVLNDFKEGKVVILVDDENRENEGDLVISADCITAENINFMAMHGRGLICLAMSQQRCQQLKLPLMVNNNNERYSTNFTVSIEASQGVTTGISASDRAKTVLAAVKPDAKPSDIVMPGHIFPVIAQPGGVLTRAGHTEASVDMARICGKEHASVICEILNADGTMARLGDLSKFSKKHKIKIGTIADLIRYRLANEPTILRISQHAINTRYGQAKLIGYRDITDNQCHLAVVFGDVASVDSVLVRVHVNNGLSDIIDDLKSEQNWPLNNVLKLIGKEKNGIVVIIDHRQTEHDLINKLSKIDASKDNSEQGDLRILGIGSQILVDIGVKRLRVIGAPKKMHALSGFDLEVVEFINTNV